MTAYDTAHPHHPDLHRCFRWSRSHLRSIWLWLRHHHGAWLLLFVNTLSIGAEPLYANSDCNNSNGKPYSGFFFSTRTTESQTRRYGDREKNLHRIICWCSACRIIVKRYSQRIFKKIIWCCRGASCCLDVVLSPRKRFKAVVDHWFHQSRTHFFYFIL